MLSKMEAQQLWDNLRGSLLETEKNIRAIINTRAWEPLGYETFAEAWRDNLSDIELSTELRAVVVFAMFDDGASKSDVAKSVAGVGPTTVTALADAHRKGFDAADAAYLSFRKRRTPTPKNSPKTIAITLSAEEHAALKASADAQGIPVKAAARTMILMSLGMAMTVQDAA